MRRAPVLLGLVLVVAVALAASALQAGGPPSPAALATSGAGVPATSSSAPPSGGRERDVEPSIAALVHAFNAGDVRLLCRPGGLVDRAVLEQQARSGGCESEYESLLGTGRMRLAVRALMLRPD